MKLVIFIAILFFPLSVHAADEVSKKPAAIKLGATLALTGNLAFIGQAERDGILLAEQEINQNLAADQPQLEVIIEDNGGDPKQAISSVQKLFEFDKVDLLFSAFTHITQAIKTNVARQKKVMVYASSVKSIAAESAYFFRDYIDSSYAGKKLAQVVRAQGHNKVSIIRDQGDACIDYASSFKKEAEFQGLSIVRDEEFISGEADLKTVLLKASRGNPDAMFFCDWRDAHTIMKQLAELQLLKIPTYHSFAPFFPIADTAEMRQLYEQNKAVTSWYGSAEEDESEQYRSFKEKFQKQFGHVPRPDSVYSYDDTKLLYSAASRCLNSAGVDQQCLIADLKTASLDGALGNLSFDYDGNSSREIVVVEVKDGKWVLVK